MALDDSFQESMDSITTLKSEKSYFDSSDAMHSNGKRGHPETPRKEPKNPLTEHESHSFFKKAQGKLTYDAFTLLLHYVQR